MVSAPPQERRVKATDRERAILVQRAHAAEVAEKAFLLAQNMANDALTLFCDGHGIPMGAEFVGIDGDDVVLRTPDPAPPGDSPPAPGATSS